jgi:hypothetical protein
MIKNTLRSSSCSAVAAVAIVVLSALAVGSACVSTVRHNGPEASARHTTAISAAAASHAQPLDYEFQ